MFRLLAVRASLGTTGAVPLSPVVGTTGLTLAPARAASSSSLDSPLGSFESRHLGPREQDQRDMLKTLKLRSIGQLVSRTVPPNVKLSKFKLPLDRPESEALALNNLRKMLAKNKIYKNFIGSGYYGTVLPPPILRNLLENPSWYTSYTPYQAEVSQGRLESLMNFQVMVSDLTGLPVAGASLLDEATAAGEALGMCVAADKRPGPKVFVVDEDVLPQTLAVLHSRAEPRGVQVLSVNLHDPDVRNRLAQGGFGTVSGVLAQYPSASGQLADNMQALADVAHRAGALFAVATDLMALTLLTPPGEFGADIAFGSAQRFGVPPGFGGPHAAFFSTSQTYVRSIPGRIIGMSRDSSGKPAYRMALQTREQHIRRERATSNICTAQALLANIAAMYAVYHGPEGLRRIAANIHALAYTLQQALKARGLKVSSSFFDTVAVYMDPHLANEVHQRAQQRKINLGRHPQGLLVAFDELSTLKDVKTILSIFAPGASTALTIAKDLLPNLPLRTSVYLQHPIFNTYRSETELTRYIHRLADKDISLTRSMISLGSCTMKLNAAAEMIPVTWPEVASIHPFAPAHQVKGYLEMISHLEKILSAVTGFAATSLQPNAGSQGELTGLLVIRRFLQTRDAGQPTQRDVCLIPRSAHGTNPASAAMAGMKIVVVACRDDGEVDLDDLAAKISENADRLACLMVTYPSTHGVFEAKIKDIVDLVHNHGGLVYMDGANMNAQCGLLSPGDIGADVCHLNLHKTFCIPHGGGGPGVGPICVAKHLEPFLPGYPYELIPDRPIDKPTSIAAVSAAPYGSASILPIPYMYLRMMGSRGIVRATQTAILSANYMAKKLSPYYPVLYTGDNGYVAHEFIIDCRGFEETSGVVCEDIAKRLIDFGFHAPTMSFPVPGTLMIEPTESESKEELDRFIDALIQIRAEIDKIAAGVWPKDNNPLKHAPHTAEVVTSDSWDRPYTRAEAVYPLPWVASRKYWPPVGRVDNVYGDKNLNVSCPCEPIESYLKP